MLSAATPKVDKTKLEAYLRYAEGYARDINLAIDDPAPSTLSGFFRLTVHLSRGANKLDRIYYITADGEHVINGAVWDLEHSPFQETLAHLPTAGFSFGPANAKVTLVVFSDFQCPYCQSLAKTLRENVAQKYPGQVRVVYQDFPLTAIHNWAQNAAEAARCLGAQNPAAFWIFHDWIFEHQKEVTAANLREKTLALVKDQHLDEGKAAACIDTHATAADVQESMKAGRALQVELTPTLFLNGRMSAGALPWDGLNDLIQREVNSPAATKN